MNCLQNLPDSRGILPRKRYMAGVFFFFFFFFFLLCVFIFTTHVTKKQNKSTKDIYHSAFENTDGVLNSFHPDSSRGHILAKPGLSSQDHCAILASLCRVFKERNEGEYN